VGSFKPDVVLLDIGLPVLDGYEVAQRLRVCRWEQPIRIIALTGYGQQADREKAARAGFDDYLVKPVEPTALTEFLRSLH
jgi:CheY-like chemotaxis protein